MCIYATTNGLGRFYMYTHMYVYVYICINNKEREAVNLRESRGDMIRAAGSRERGLEIM